VVRDFSPRRIPASFRYAGRGLWHVLRTEQNARIHVAAGTIVLVLAIILEVSLVEMAVLILSVGFVIAAEILNTIIEDFLDIIHPEHHQAVRKIKDALAGAVLVAALVAVGVGLCIFGPRLVAAFGGPAV
jgi:diacylglycerol kinase